MQVIEWDGKPITKPGLYAGVPNEVYHGQLTETPSVSRSGLWRIFDESPRHYWHDSYLNPNREVEEKSDAINLGSATHHLILGEANFCRQFVVRPEKWDSWRTNDAKAWREEMISRGLTVLEAKHLDLIRGMAESLAQEPMVKAGILNGLIEHSLVWRDKETGVWLKVRPDCIPTDGTDIGDLKTTARIFDDDLQRSISDTGMNIQAAMIAEGFREVLGIEVTSFNPIFVESKPPHCVQIKTMLPEDVELGHRQFRVALRRFARCVEKGVWPGPGGHQQDATYAGLTPWARTAAERRISIIEAELEFA